MFNGGVDMTTNAEHCDVLHHHSKKINEVFKKMPEDDVLFDLAELYKVFGDSTRIKILYALFNEDMCVCDIAELLNMTQSAISHQLKVLKNSKLVKSRRDGKSVIYSLDDHHVAGIINMGLEHINH